MLHNTLNPLKQAIASVSSQPPYIVLWDQRPGTSSYQPKLTSWLLLGISKPSTSSSHLGLLYSSGRMALGKTQVGVEFGLHHPENTRPCAPSEQLQTTSEHHYPAPAKLIRHGRRRLVVSGHNQSLQLTGLGKSLPLTCQQ